MVRKMFFEPAPRSEIPDKFFFINPQTIDTEN
jgi:hypothetical protein